MGSVPPMQVLEVGANLSAHIARPPILRTDQALLVAACRSSSFLEASLNLGWSQHAPMQDIRRHRTTAVAKNTEPERLSVL
jgi:hypothetical protein